MSVISPKTPFGTLKTIPYLVSSPHVQIRLPAALYGWMWALACPPSGVSERGVEYHLPLADASAYSSVRCPGRTRASGRCVPGVNGVNSSLHAHAHAHEQCSMMSGAFLARDSCSAIHPVLRPAQVRVQEVRPECRVVQRDLTPASAYYMRDMSRTQPIVPLLHPER